MQLLIAMPLAQTAKNLQGKWFKDLQEILLTTNNKVAVIKQIISQYKNIYKNEDEHLTWLEALSYFYSKDYDSAANLFRELINIPDNTYVVQASIVLDVCKPHLSETPKISMPKA